MKCEWKESFHNKLDDYETTPPEGLFDDIMSILPPLEENQESPVTPITEVSPTSKTRKLKIVFASVLSAAAVLLLVFVNKHTLHSNDVMNINDKLTINQERSQNPAYEQAVVNDETESGSSFGNQLQTMFAPAKKVFQSTTSSLQQTSTNSLAMLEQSDNITKNENDISQTNNEGVENVQSAQTAESGAKERKEDRKHRDFYDYTTTSRRDYNNQPLRLGLLVAGMPTATASDRLALGMPTGAGEVGQTVSEETKVVKNANHHQPITFGLSLAFPIMSKLSVESGVVYSYHHSDISYEVGLSLHHVDQRLHFVGIPLHLNYQLLSKRNVAVYVSGGGTVEKLVYGKQKEKFDGEEEILTNKVTQKELQWSVSFRLGSEYKMTDYTSLYIEPGVAYHFDNKSELQTVYKDRPLSFELKAGLRFNLQR